MASSGLTQVGERFRERFTELLPEIQERWPQVAHEALTNTRGSFDEVVAVIAAQTGRTSAVVQEQLLEFMDVAGEQTRKLGDSIVEGANTHQSTTTLAQDAAIQYQR